MGVNTTTVGRLLDEAVAKVPGGDALVYPDLGIRYTYREFQEECERLAKGLLALGIRRGDKVAIWATNVPEWIVAQFATARIGAVLVNVNTNSRAFELEYLLKHSDCSTILLIEGVQGCEYLDTIAAICPDLSAFQPGQVHSERVPLLRNIVVIGQQKHPGMFTWGEVLALGGGVSAEELKAVEAEVSADDVVNMQYTSGTTGFPKGVMLSHTNLVVTARSVAECMNLTERDRMAICVPFFHCFGCVLATLTAVVAGAAMVPVVTFKAERVLAAVEQEKCTVLHGVPTMFIAELQAMDERSYDTSSLRTGIMAGAPCPIEVMKSVVDRMGAREMCITYGLTEAAPGVTMTRTSDPIERRVTTVGRALPHVEIKIIDVTTGVALPPGKQGELCTRGPNVMKGYYKMPEATAAAIDSEGWLHTGDLAVADADGYYKITGRAKDMIIRGGENIYPREVEEFLYTHPKVKDVSVVGVPSARYGEEVAVFIQLKDGETATADEITEFCRDRISRFKIPAFIFIVDAFPTTASGKVQKFKLREQATKRLGREKDATVETA